MLTRLTTGWVLIVSLTATSAQAQHLPFSPGCQHCASTMPAPVVPMVPIMSAPPFAVGVNPACGCRAAAFPPPVVQQQLRPLVEMQYRPQQVVTYQDVVKTQVRREQHVVSVPVTTTRQVVVDEGNYRMVWVPKMVTRQIAETTIRQQVQQRDVPYQVVERIPQVQTQLIPQQTVRYVPEFRTVYGYGAPFAATAAVPVPTPVVAQAAPVPTPTTAKQAATPQPNLSQPAVPQAAAASDGDWKSIPQRQAQTEAPIQQQSFERQQAAEPRRAFSPGVPTAVRAYPGMFR